ncbi:hypothetical protein TIFTF001_046205 [Ficus carica]|uniref:NB-ARC domain-containing protein n=1 Tax=Ficus carica TaxID=3494 RepID=A0AA88CR95_FICCA|nr:hypothetical protein TIFTF001_046205 [Ficus carica]
MEKLNRRKEDIDSRLRTEIVEGETKLKAEVQFWLQSVEKIDAEINAINQQVEAVKCFSRAGIGKNVVQKIEEVEKLYRTGEFPDGLILQLPRQTGDVQPTTTLGGETTFTRKMKDIWELLMDDEVRKIGVYGMGGMGKTTLMKHINNRLLEKKEKFDGTIWVTVSKASSIVKLQDAIARRIEFDISNYDDDERASKLHAELSKIKRCVLILDDLWDVYRLDEVGIPEPSPQNGSKLVLTTRLLNVCHGMSCKAIPMERLTDMESLNLFLDTVGRDVLSIQNMKVMVNFFVKECARLPLAIVTIAGSLKGIVNYSNWKTALEDLKASTDGTNEILEKLKFSYDRLNDKNLQDCLVYCALFPEDYAIGRNELIEYLIAEEIVQGRNRQAELERGQAMLNKLVYACLLEDTTGYAGKACVKMHDLIRDMALKITRDSPRLLVEAGTGLKCVPDEENWKEDLVKISLMHNQISNIPSSFESPKCPTLSTLLLNGNYGFRSISNNFFLHIKELSLLDLSETLIENLPESISELVNLTALLLRGCRSLTYVPSLAKLTALKRLDFGGSGIKEVPQGMENLSRLRYLEFYRCEQLKMIPDGILCKLSKLHYLSLNRHDCETKIRGEELVELTKLEELYCKWYDHDRFNAYVRSMADGGPTHYILQVGLVTFRIDPVFLFKEGGKGVIFANSDLRKSVATAGDCSVLLPEDVEKLCIQKCCIDASSLCELITSFKNLTNLRECYMTECDGLEHLFVYSSSIIPLLQRLELLYLKGVRDLRGLIRREKVASTPLPPVTFSSLKTLTVINCDKIKRLFIDTDLLPNLKDILVLDCKQLVEIISAASDHGEQEEEYQDEEAAGGCDHWVISTVILPKLCKLRLELLPKLKSIPVVADLSLREVQIEKCPKLKRVTCLDRDPCPPSLEKVCIDDDLWESLEWNHPSAKDAVESVRREW